MSNHNSMSNYTSTCYAILATPRSGSSLLAGVVHSLGINMGQHLMSPCDHNEKGFFEDLEFLEIHKHMYGTIPYLFDDPVTKNKEVVKPAYVNLVRKRCSQPKWGVKDPRMVFLIEEFKSNLTASCRLKLISSARPINQSAKSMAKVLGVDYKRAGEIIGRYEIARLDSLKWAKENNIPHMVVNYEEMMTNTSETVNKIAEFCEESDQATIQMAGLLVDKSLWHNK